MKSFLKKFLPRTLFGRSLMILVIPVLLIQIITTFIFFDRHWDKVTGRLANAVAGEIAVVAQELEKDPSPENLEYISAYAYKNLQIVVNFAEGAGLAENIIGESDQSVITRSLGPALEKFVSRPFHISVDIHEKWVEVSVQLENGLLSISLPQRRLFSSSGYVFLLWMISVSLVLLAIAILFMRNQIRPIRRLAVVAERIGRGMDIPPSFKPEGAREIRQATRSFIEMHDRIKRQIQQRTAMLAGVSHDLRTPLTRMKLQTAMMGDSSDVSALKGDIADMERMIDAYLDFARGEGGEQSEQQDIKAMLERVVTGVKRQGKDVELETEGDLTLQIRPIAFERAINNVVSNARKYADKIWIHAAYENGKITIRIDDDGPGIPDDKLEEVFKPFYRVEESRNTSTGGVGLGLPIVQDIIHGHGGEVWLERSNKGGVCVIIELPA